MRWDAVGYFAGMLLMRAQPLLEAVLLTALLPVEDFGRWSWALAFYAGVIALAHGGMPAAMLRYAAIHRQEGPALLHFALRQLFYWMVIGIGGLFGLSFTVPLAVRWLMWAFLPAVPSFLVAEVVRAYLRGRYENLRLFRWQVTSTTIGLLVLAGFALTWGLKGAALARTLQPLWQLLPIASLLLQALRSEKRIYPGFVRFGYTSLWGNLALEGIFVLPTWFIGWWSGSPTAIAYWRWATLLPLNIRVLFAQWVSYLYPAWARAGDKAFTLYMQQRWKVWGVASLCAIGLAIWGFFWHIFPGEAYLAARPYYWGAVGVGWLWSTEALLLPNLLSAFGDIKAYSRAYLIGLLVSLPFYSAGQGNLWWYLVGLGAGSIGAVFAARKVTHRLAARV
ncbi:MAG: hypothetical protein KatS3mg025_0243 [Bacteroidia bacterium]|nr:MAG: hypothetical protein KatS3mg025_0243 [Bacteroidia bacterium]